MLATGARRLVNITESDWRAFKKVRERALQRFSQRVLDDCLRICQENGATAHERYLNLYRLLQDRDQEMARTFDDPRRSTAKLCLLLMRRQGLVTDEEMAEFSPEVQRAARLEWSA